MKLRTRPAPDGLELKVLIEHPMESGRRTDETSGQRVPPHYIRQLRVDLNGRTVIRADLGTAIARNPYFAFYLKDGKPGDLIQVSWEDTHGQRESGQIRVGIPA